MSGQPRNANAPPTERTRITREFQQALRERLAGARTLASRLARRVKCSPATIRALVRPERLGTASRFVDPIGAVLGLDMAVLRYPNSRDVVDASGGRHERDELVLRALLAEVLVRSDHAGELCRD